MDDPRMINMGKPDALLCVIKEGVMLPLESNNCRLPAFVWRNVVFWCRWWIACTSKEKGTYLRAYLKSHVVKLRRDDVPEDIMNACSSENTIMFIWDLRNTAVIILNAFSWLHITGIAGNFMLKGHLHTGAARFSALQGKLSIFKKNISQSWNTQLENNRKILPEADFLRNHHRRGRFVLRLRDN